MKRDALYPIRVEMSTKIGQRIRELRDERGLRQDQMFGLDRSYMSDVERGKKMPSLTVLKVLSVGFKVSMAEMVETL